MYGYNRKRLLRDEYIFRVNRVIDYIDRNIDKDLSLDDLAKIANFSSFHFHRIFRALVGETLNSFIRRIRAERAASQLVDNPKKTITEVALDCGFSDSASFAREFKAKFGMSATEWREYGYRQKSKIRIADSKNKQTDSKKGKDLPTSSGYAVSDTQFQMRRKDMMDREKLQVEVKELPELHVAYARHIGPFQGIGDAFARLFKWAGPRRLLNFPRTMVLSVYHDDPNVTDQDKLRSSACITVPAETKVEGEIGAMDIPGGLFAVAHFEIAQDEFGDAWDALMGDWMPESGYQPDDRMCYEVCLNVPKDHPENKFIIDICMPVKPL